MFNTVFIPDLSSGTWLGHLKKNGKIYFLIEIRIITGSDHICGIQNTGKYKYYEFMKYIGNINSHRAAAASSAPLDVFKLGVNLIPFLIIFKVV